METQQKAGPTNSEIADVCVRIADLLEAQEANRFRIKAYRNAARNIEMSSVSVASLAFDDDQKKIMGLPGVGRTIAAVVREYVHTGKVRMLDRLEGDTAPEDLFTVVPGIGPELAGRIITTLHLSTLEELEQAAHDGRLEAVHGLAGRRIRGIRESLSAMLDRTGRQRSHTYVQRQANPPDTPEKPSVSLILAIDEEYRSKSAAGSIRRIAPRRFNPGGEAWLPVYHTDRDGWYFTVMFSNTELAHELGRTDDWVVLNFEHEAIEHRCTVVTEHLGILKGKRVIRGREPECVVYYRSIEQSHFPELKRAG